jgi:hypothetical protein
MIKDKIMKINIKEFIEYILYILAVIFIAILSLVICIYYDILYTFYGGFICGIVPITFAVILCLFYFKKRVIKNEKNKEKN